MEILHTDNGKNGSFYIEEEGKKIAEMTYVWAGSDKMIIDHTEVAESLKGKSIGKQLVQKAVEYARDKGFKILPLCPFAKAVFDKTPAYNDIVF